MKKINLFLIIVISLILIDRVIKEFVLHFLNETIVVIPKVLSLYLVYNNGVAFGLFKNFPYVIEVITGFIILISFYALPRIPEKYVAPMAVIIGGAAGNFIDRIIYNHGVIDYIAVRYFSVFNFADIAISLGVLWTIVYLYTDENTDDEAKTKKTKRKKNRSQKAHNTSA